MRRLKLMILSVAIVGAMLPITATAQAGPPEHCDPAGDLPDLCPVVYQVCQTKVGQKVCDD